MANYHIQKKVPDYKLYDRKEVLESISHQNKITLQSLRDESIKLSHQYKIEEQSMNHKHKMEEYDKELEIVNTMIKGKITTK